jgi:hypothetical protein
MTDLDQKIAAYQDRHGKPPHPVQIAAWKRQLEESR